MTFAEIETPAVLVDETIARMNIKKCQAYFDRHDIMLRPHIKTHKLPRFARRQLDAGAKGITCQKISEAEIMADHGIDDILITYNIIGAAKLKRLVALSRRIERLCVVADSEVVARGLSQAFAAERRPVEVMIECDTGGCRCGVQSPKAAVKLAGTITAMPELLFAGLMTYPAPDGGGDVQAFMTAALELLRSADIACPVISSGGSPDMWRAHDVPVVTEYRVGTYIYNDRSLVMRKTCNWEDCALTVLATVVSTPIESRAVIDAGSKILTSDLIGLEHYGVVSDRPDLVVTGLSEEHGIVGRLNGSSTGLTVGERLRIVPNHCCVVSNMVDSVVLHDGEKPIDRVSVAARGCIV